ncbi:MAG: aminopeptidase [Candidatus Eisenbacteria bacterium]
MRDPRTQQLAHLIVHHSTRIQPGEAMLIEAFDLRNSLVLDLVDEVQKAGGVPVVSLRDNAVIRRQLLGATEAQLKLQGDIELHQMKQVQAYVGIRASENVSELGDVPADKMALFQKLVAQPVHLQYRVNHTKWVVLRWPNAAMAQLANTSTEAFEDFYFSVCNVDYKRMQQAIVPLRERMLRTDRVHLKSPGTDLRFSIKDIGVISCHGERNIPDGECFTAPVRDSVEGTIRYNTQSVYLGTTYDQLEFTFEKGRIVKATGTPQDKLDQLLDTDEGARYIGEFSLGFNPHILKPMKDTLFDEKIAGSLHFTPGQCYETTENGNRSKIHWDLVLIQRPEYGGGEVWFDGELIRKDGRFVVKDLEGLNPENLA